MTGAAGRVVGADVRAEHVPEVLVPALADQVQVDLAERGQPAVRVVDLVDRAGAVVDPDPVVADRAVDDGGEHPAVGVLERDLLAVLQQRHALRVVPQGADHGGAVALRVRAENAVRVVGVAADQLLVVVVARPGWRARRGPPRRRASPGRQRPRSGGVRGQRGVHRAAGDRGVGRLRPALGGGARLAARRWPCRLRRPLRLGGGRLRLRGRAGPAWLAGLSRRPSPAPRSAAGWLFGPWLASSGSPAVPARGSEVLLVVTRYLRC